MTDRNISIVFLYFMASLENFFVFLCHPLAPCWLQLIHSSSFCPLWFTWSCACFYHKGAQVEKENLLLHILNSVFLDLRVMAKDESSRQCRQRFSAAGAKVEHGFSWQADINHELTVNICHAASHLYNLPVFMLLGVHAAIERIWPQPVKWQTLSLECTLLLDWPTVSLWPHTAVLSQNQMEAVIRFLQDHRVLQVLFFLSQSSFNSSVTTSSRLNGHKQRASTCPLQMLLHNHCSFSGIPFETVAQKHI